MGTDKAFLEFGGQTLLERALAVMAAACERVTIVGDPAKFANHGTVVADVFPGCGPLGGIHAALRSSLSELNVMLAVDTPFVSWTLLQYLISQARAKPDAIVVVPVSDERRQPLCAIYRREFADVAESALRSGNNRIDRLFDLVETRTIAEEELNVAGFSSGIFRNMNTPEELKTEKGRA